MSASSFHKWQGLNRLWNAGLFIAVFVLVFSPILVHAQSSAFVRSTISQDGPVWVGEQVPFQISLLVTGRFTGSPKFDLPEISGALLVKIPDRPVLGSEQVAGESFISQTHDFAFYALRPGKYLLPPISVRFSSIASIGSPPVVHQLDTTAMQIEAMTPPGAEGFGISVSTYNLEGSETWQPQLPDTARVGDAFTRKIKIRAANVPGILLTPLPVTEEVMGAGIYPDAPVVRDYAERGDFYGERVEVVTYVCEERGKLTLPSLVFYWWDLETEEVKQIEFPAVTLKVKANPSLAKSKVRSAIGDSSSSGSQWLFLGMITLTLFGFAAFWVFRHSIAAFWKAQKNRRRESETAYFKRFKKACLSNDPSEAHRRLMTWLDQVCAEWKITTLEDFSRLSQDPGLESELRKLNAVLFAQDTQPSSGAWSGSNLYRSVANVRKRIVQTKNVERTRAEKLPPLNPIEN